MSRPYGKIKVYGRALTAPTNISSLTVQNSKLAGAIVWYFLRATWIVPRGSKAKASGDTATQTLLRFFIQYTYMMSNKENSVYYFWIWLEAFVQFAQPVHAACSALLAKLRIECIALSVLYVIRKGSCHLNTAFCAIWMWIGKASALVRLRFL